MLSNNLPERVRIVEVGPRDGLQNEATPVATEDKFSFVEKLVSAGLREIELTSFVRPDRIPQLSDAKELLALVNAHGFGEEMRFSGLVPNMKGLDAAREAGMKEVAIFLATSNSFSQKNINATIEESFQRAEPVVKQAREYGMRVRGYLSTVFGCPYEGDVPVSSVLDGTQRLLEMGVYEVSLGDTTGIGTPGRVEEVLGALLGSISPSKLAMHFHDTRGMAIANILVSLTMGITSYDASAGGLGGCPYAKGASGNVATEDVVYLMDSLGIETGISLEKLADASAFMMSALGRQSPSKVHQAIRSSKSKS